MSNSFFFFFFFLPFFRQENHVSPFSFFSTGGLVIPQVFSTTSFYWAMPTFFSSSPSASETKGGLPH